MDNNVKQEFDRETMEHYAEKWSDHAAEIKLTHEGIGIQKKQQARWSCAQAEEKIMKIPGKETYFTKIKVMSGDTENNDLNMLFGLAPKL